LKLLFQGETKKGEAHRGGGGGSFSKDLERPLQPAGERGTWEEDRPEGKKRGKEQIKNPYILKPFPGVNHSSYFQLGNLGALERLVRGESIL